MSQHAFESGGSQSMAKITSGGKPYREGAWQIGLLVASTLPSHQNML
jgi:hypothetical protein